MWYWIVIIFLMFVTMSKITVLQDTERIVIYTLGKYKAMAGPGLFIKALWGSDFYVRLRCGIRGQLISREYGRFKDCDVPVRFAEHIETGSQIRIIGFEENNAIVEKVKMRIVRCEKCGHKNEVNA